MTFNKMRQVRHEAISYEDIDTKICSMHLSTPEEVMEDKIRN